MKLPMLAEKFTQLYTEHTTTEEIHDAITFLKQQKLSRSTESDFLKQIFNQLNMYNGEQLTPKSQSDQKLNEAVTILAKSQKRRR